jgi:glycosyltransferase involved in cell wall biosynthesis
VNVLHLGAGNLYGGIETLLVTLARRRGLCPEMEPRFGLCFEGRLSEELRAAEVSVDVLGAVRFSRPWTVWQARQRLQALLARERPDVVICHECWPHALFAPVVRRSGLPLVFWAHDLHSGLGWPERWARRTPPDLVLANSRATLATLEVLFPSALAEVLYLPVDAPPEEFRDPEVRRSVRAELATPDDAVVIIQAARLESWKGQHVLVEALGLLAAEAAGWHCWIAGGAQRAEEGEYLASLQRRIAWLKLGDRVRFLGARRDVPRLLAAADIHCQPNTGPEPFGIAFVEALYAGLPVVTAGIGGALEIVDDTCGVLLPPGDSPALVSALAALIRDSERRRRLGAAGPARARQLCDPAPQLTALADGLARGTAERRRRVALQEALA